RATHEIFRNQLLDQQVAVGAKPPKLPLGQGRDSLLPPESEFDPRSTANRGSLEPAHERQDFKHHLRLRADRHGAILPPRSESWARPKSSRGRSTSDSF